MSDVAFTSWGSANSIGPSCHVLRFGTFHIGIDYGAGAREEDHEPAYSGTLDALIVTHAHRDHVGMLPRALSRWPRAQCWATFETMSLARWVWEDELNVCRADGRPYPFTPEEIDHASRRIRRLIAGQPVELNDDLTVRPFSAGHILGAVGLEFRYHGERYIVTGDIGLRGHGFIQGADVPRYERSRLLVRESTYVGQYPVAERTDITARFISQVDEVLENGGRVLIPTLSIDRMPEVYAILHEADIDREWPVWVIGGVKPSEIYLEYAPGAHVLRSMRRFEHRQHQDDTRKSGLPMVILASSGMVAKNSPSYSWATDILDDGESAIFFVNWQDPRMPGGLILNAGNDAEVELPTGSYKRRCIVDRFDFSSHAKEDEMEEIERRLNPDEIIHVHGEDARIDSFIASRKNSSPSRHKAQVGVVFPL